MPFILLFKKVPKMTPTLKFICYNCFPLFVVFRPKWKMRTILNGQLKEIKPFEQKRLLQKLTHKAACIILWTKLQIVFSKVVTYLTLASLEIMQKVILLNNLITCIFWLHLIIIIKFRFQRFVGQLVWPIDFFSSFSKTWFN